MGKAAAWRRVQQIFVERAEADALFHGIVSKVCDQFIGCAENLREDHVEIRDLVCHKLLVTTVFNDCPKAEGQPGGWTEYSMKFSQVLANICEGKAVLQRSDVDLQRIVQGEC